MIHLHGIKVKTGFSYLFCIGKPSVKHGFTSPCYPVGMEIFLVLTVTAMIIVVIVDTQQKRRAFLCQQEQAIRRN